MWDGLRMSAMGLAQGKMGWQSAGIRNGGRELGALGALGAFGVEFLFLKE